MSLVAPSLAQDGGASRPDAPAGPARALEVATGARHTCVRMSDATLRCWGHNGYGQLGDGTRQDRPRPVVATAVRAPITQVQAGNGFTCARHVDGTLSCWGYNVYGQTGTGAAGERVETPTLVQRIRGMGLMRAGDAAMCAIVGGRLHCWGRMEPDWDRPNPTPRFVRSPHPVTQVSMDDFTCVVTSAEELHCWGSNHTPRPRSMGLSQVLDVVQGGLGACALTRLGRVHCWGWNDSGQLGRAFDPARDTDYSTTPTEIPGLSSARAIAAGDTHRCAQMADGTVRCWGASWGNPGFPSTCLQRTRHSSGGGSARQWDYCPTPTPVPGLRGVIDIDARDERTCAVTDRGAVHCWGTGEPMSAVTPR